MYEFPRVSEYRHSFHHIPKKSSRIKKWSIFLHFHSTGVIGDTRKTNRDLTLGTDGQRYSETSYFGEDSNNSKNAQFLLGSPVSLCTTVLSVGSGLCPGSAWPQDCCSPLPCPQPAPWHQFQSIPCSSSKGLMCVFAFKEKDFPGNY